MFEDKPLVCKDCQKEFVFTVGEQEFFKEKGLDNEPTRCSDCRKARRQAKKSQRKRFAAICSDCGAETTVPFKPKEGHPVYCKECYINHKN